MFGQDDPRLASAAFRAADEWQPPQTSAAPHDCQPVAAAARAYALARLKVMILASVQEEPDARVLATEFSCAQCKVASAVIYACLSTNNNRQSAHGWLFESEKPDLDQDHPVAELAISSSGDVLVSPGCPANYEAMRDRLSGLKVAASRRDGAPFPSNSVTASTRAHEQTAESEPDDLTPTIRTEKLHEVNATPPSNGRTTEPAVVAARGAALSLTLIALISYLDWRVPYDRADGADLSTTRSSVATPEDLPPPAALPKPRVSASEVAASDSPAGAPVTVVPPIMTSETQRPTQEKSQATPQRSAKLAGAGVVGATIAPLDVREVPTRTRGERLVRATSGTNRFRRHQAHCNRSGFWGRAICKEAARLKQCHPDKWDKIPQCVVQKFDYVME